MCLSMHSELLRFFFLKHRFKTSWIEKRLNLKFDIIGKNLQEVIILLPRKALTGLTQNYVA